MAIRTIMIVPSRISQMRIKNKDFSSAHWVYKFTDVITNEEVYLSLPYNMYLAILNINDGDSLILTCKPWRKVDIAIFNEPKNVKQLYGTVELAGTSRRNIVRHKFPELFI